MPESTATQKYGWVLPIAAIICGVFCIYIFVVRGVAPRPETYTELYFDSYPTSTARAMTAGQVLPFSFTIHNKEGTETDYAYRVYFSATDASIAPIENASFTLADGQSQTLQEHYVARSGDTGKVVVELTGRNQHIDFLVPNGTSL
jgi:hypothetical protein